MSQTEPMPRGGKREGAGRPTDLPKTKTFIARVTPEEYELLRSTLDNHRTAKKPDSTKN